METTAEVNLTKKTANWEQSQPSFNITLDVRGYVCPIPVLKTRKLLKKMGAGEIARIQATDPNMREDMALFCSESDHTIVAIEESDRLITLYIQKS